MEENKSKKPFNVTAYIVGVMVVALIIKILFIWLTPNATSKFINKAVEQAKASITLPAKIDESTTAVDITAELNAIRYHYIISGSDPNNVTNDDYKKYLLSGVCLNDTEKNLLNQGINLEYSTVFKDVSKTLFVSIKKEDCLNYQIPTKTFSDIQPIQLEK